jgi:hypothetical protein
LALFFFDFFNIKKVGFLKLSVFFRFFFGFFSLMKQIRFFFDFFFLKKKIFLIVYSAYHGTTVTTTDISPHKWHHIHDYKKKKWVHVAAQPDAYRGIYQSPEHCDATLGKLYAAEVAGIAQQVTAEGRGVGLFLAESLQSCAGQVFLPEGYLKPVYESVRPKLVTSEEGDHSKNKYFLQGRQSGRRTVSRR